MARFLVRAKITCPRSFVAMIPRKLSLELEKPRYRRLGIVLEQISVEEVSD